MPFIITSDSDNYKAFNALGFHSTEEWNLALRHCTEECTCVPKETHVVNDLRHILKENRGSVCHKHTGGSGAGNNNPPHTALF